MAAQPTQPYAWSEWPAWSDRSDRTERTGHSHRATLRRQEPAVQAARARASRRRLRRARRARTLAVLFLLLVAALVLLFPRVVHTQSAGEMPAGIEYTVVPGDTLWEIASRYAGRRDVREVIWRIEQANGLRSAEIQPGQVLFIPAIPGSTLAGR